MLTCTYRTTFYCIVLRRTALLCFIVLSGVALCCVIMHSVALHCRNTVDSRCTPRSSSTFTVSLGPRPHVPELHCTSRTCSISGSLARVAQSRSCSLESSCSQVACRPPPFADLVCPRSWSPCVLKEDPLGSPLWESYCRSRTTPLCYESWREAQAGTSRLNRLQELCRPSPFREQQCNACYTLHYRAPGNV